MPKMPKDAKNDTLQEPPQETPEDDTEPLRNGLRAVNDAAEGMSPVGLPSGAGVAEDDMPLSVMQDGGPITGSLEGQDAMVPRNTTPLSEADAPGPVFNPETWWPSAIRSWLSSAAHMAPIYTG